MTPVTDPALLAQLNTPAAPPPGLKPVTDPALLEQLNGSSAGAPSHSGLEGWSAGDAIASVPETLLHLGSGAVAAPVAGLAGLLEGGINKGSELFTGKPAGPDAADVVSKLQSALTYEPRTQGGKDLSGVIEYLPGQLAKGGDYAGSKTAEVTGSPAAGAAVNAGIQALPALLLHESVPLLKRGGQAVADTVVNAVRPLTRTGQEQIAADILRRQASDAGTAATNLDTAEPIVPGSARNTGEASQDIGLLNLEKGVRGRNPVPFGERTSAQNAARQAELESVGGSPGDIDLAKDRRDALTAPMRDQALTAANDNSSAIQALTAAVDDRFRSKASALQDKGRFDTFEAQNEGATQNPFSPVPGAAGPVPGRYHPRANRLGEGSDASSDMDAIIDQRQGEMRTAQTDLQQLQDQGVTALQTSHVTNAIDGILNTPGLRASQVVRKALTGISDHLDSLTDENGLIDSRDLYTVRKEIGNYIDGAAKDSNSWDKRLSGGLNRDIQHAIDDAIEGAAPGFKAYLQKYRDLSEPIDQMKVMQGIRDKGNTTAVDVLTGHNFLSPAGYSRALDAALEGDSRLTPAQRARLEAVRTDLDNSNAIAGPAIKALGSDTFQNLSRDQVLGGAGALAQDLHPALRVATKPLDWLYKAAGSDSRVNDLLTQAMLDPRTAASMLRRGRPSREALASAIRNRQQLSPDVAAEITPQALSNDSGRRMALALLAAQGAR